MLVDGQGPVSQKKVIKQPKQGTLLHTKIAVPLSHTCLVARPRLTAQLAGEGGGRVLLISAPAGFGKTTLLAGWAMQQNGRIAWLSLDEGDNDLARFWRYVIAALQAAAPTLSIELADFTAASWESLLTQLINELTAVIPADDPLTLVLDDYYLIHTNTIHQSLSFLLYHQPRSLHVVILTRADPPLALARLRVQGRLWELRAADLRFTLAEMEAFFSCTLPFALSLAAKKTLAERIEGWAAGLQLAALSMRHLVANDVESFVKGFSGAERYVFNYLLEEVLQQQPARIQTFLLHTSVLRTLTPGLCTAVTGYEDAREILVRLAQENLFVLPLDETGQWYRYHHLFASALRSRLEQTEPALVQELRHRAAAWYAAQGSGDAIPSHLLSAAAMPPSEPQSALTDPLTEREWGILMLIAQGYSNQQIADRLVISVGTVKGHVNHLLSKLNAKSRTEAVAQAQRLGLHKS